MSSENISSASTVFSAIESDFETSHKINDDLVLKLFEELMKFDNGADAVKEFTWRFAVGEKDHHVVESKECRKVFLIDFKKCKKFLENFLAHQD